MKKNVYLIGWVLQNTTMIGGIQGNSVKWHVDNIAPGIYVLKAYSKKSIMTVKVVYTK